MVLFRADTSHITVPESRAVPRVWSLALDRKPDFGEKTLVHGSDCESA